MTGMLINSNATDRLSQLCLHNSTSHGLAGANFFVFRADEHSEVRLRMAEDLIPTSVIVNCDRLGKINFSIRALRRQFVV